MKREEKMVNGFIKTRHILFHPLSIIAVVGIVGYVTMLLRCIDGRPHCFMEMMFETQRKKQGNGG